MNLVFKVCVIYSLPEIKVLYTKLRIEKNYEKPKLQIHYLNEFHRISSLKSQAEVMEMQKNKMTIEQMRAQCEMLKRHRRK